MKPYIRKLINIKKNGYDYRLFFKDEYGNLYGGIQSFLSWQDALQYGLKHLNTKNEV